MSVIATLVIGSNGGTSLQGSSTALSTPVDRERFLALHRSAGAYITGRNSFSSESYAQSHAPVLILSRTIEALPDAAPNGATFIDISRGLADAMRRIVSTYQSPIVIEAGATLFLELLRNGCIEECDLSIVPIDGDSDFVDLKEILDHLEILSDEVRDGTRLLKCRYKGSSAYS